MIWNYFAQEICLFFPHLLIFFHHLDPKQLMNIYILGYDPLLVYFVAQIISTLVTGSSCVWLLGLFDIPHDCGNSYLFLFLSFPFPFLFFSFLFFLFKELLTCCHYKMLRFFLCVCCSSSRIVSPRVLFLLLENGMRNQGVGARCACCYSSVISFRSS